MFEMDTNKIKLCLEWVQINSNYDSFSNNFMTLSVTIFVTIIVQYFILDLYFKYYLHVTGCDDIDELYHQDIE